ncbi:MAG: DinB family protein [Ginsengibacter sp.]
MKPNQPEVWQRGPLPNIPPLLQPVAHALLQAREEIEDLMTDFDDKLLWGKPAGLASPAFHLQHLSGVLDRVFTYARAELLSADQLSHLKAEGEISTAVNINALVSRFNRQVDEALVQLKNTDEKTLTDFRGVGRQQLPSTVIGLLFHAAEHTMRHVGQLLVTISILKNEKL